MSENKGFEHDGNNTTPPSAQPAQTNQWPQQGGQPGVSAQPNPTQGAQPGIPHQPSGPQNGQPTPYQIPAGAPVNAPTGPSHHLMVWAKQDMASVKFGAVLALVGILLFFVPLFSWLSVGDSKSSVSLSGVGHVAVHGMDLSGDDGEAIEVIGMINSLAPALTGPVHTMLIWTGILLIVAGAITALTTSRLGDVIAAVASGCMAVSLILVTSVPIHQINKALSDSTNPVHAKIGAGVIISIMLLIAAVVVSIVHFVRKPAPSRTMASADQL